MSPRRRGRIMKEKMCIYFLSRKYHLLALYLSSTTGGYPFRRGDWKMYTYIQRVIADKYIACS